MRGDGSIIRRKDSPNVWIQFCVRGQVYREKGGRTEAEARKKLRKRLAEIAGDTFVGPEAERRTVPEILDLYEAELVRRGKKSVRTMRCHLQPVRRFFAFHRAHSVTTKLIQRYQAERSAQGKANGTINREVGALKQAYNLAKRQDLLSRVPYISFLREAQARQGFFEAPEVEAAAGHLGEPLGDLVRFAFLSAWRYGEVVALRWEQVNRAAGEARLADTKSGEPRVLPLEGKLLDLVERRWAARQHELPGGGAALSPYVFHRGGKPVRDFRKAWAAACKNAGVPGRLFHDLRRSAVRAMVRAGVPRSVAMEISGHETESTFERYNITDDRDRREALRRTQEFTDSQTRNLISLPKN